VPRSTGTATTTSAATTSCGGYSSISGRRTRLRKRWPADEFHGTEADVSEFVVSQVDDQTFTSDGFPFGRRVVACRDQEACSQARSNEEGGGSQVRGQAVDGQEARGQACGSEEGGGSYVGGQACGSEEVDGTQVNGREVNGQAVDGTEINGREVSSQAFDGTEINRREVNGQEAGGSQVDGQACGDEETGGPWDHHADGHRSAPVDELAGVGLPGPVGAGRRASPVGIGP
jgi:hypothetical protein